MYKSSFNRRLQIPDDLLERLDFFLNFSTLPHHLFDGGNRVHRGTVIPVEFLTNVVEGKIKQLSTEIDGDLSGVDDVSRSFRSNEIAVFNLEEVFNFLLDVFHG